jgi:CRISPR-associated protein Cas2
MARKLSPYRMGWILAIFDLPVGSSEQRLAANKFRNYLLDDGYVMLQFSVYVRPCVSYEHLEKHSERIKAAAPTQGFVKVMYFTDRQWALSLNLIGGGQDRGRRETKPVMPSQIIFW